jgi:hypothetical protein
VPPDKVNHPFGDLLFFLLVFFLILGIELFPVGVARRKLNFNGALSRWGHGFIEAVKLCFNTLVFTVGDVGWIKRRRTRCP